MQLPDFIKRALAYFDKAEANLTASVDLPKAQARILLLEGEAVSAAKALADAKQAIEAKDAELQTLKADLEAKGAELAAQQKKLADEQGRTDANLAGLGVDPKDIPAGPDEPAKAQNVWTRLNALEGEARREFYLKHWDELRRTEPPQ